MNWAWASSLDQLWRSPSIPMWLTLAAAGFFGFIVVVTLLRAEKSVANGALTVITLLAVGIAVASTLRGQGAVSRSAPNEAHASPVTATGLAALSCVDDLAGDVVQQACEKALFGSAESTAAAVSYTAAMITRLTALGDAGAQHAMSPEMQALRRAIERDRYGLVAQVLTVRERCTPTECAAYRSLTDNHQIITNMDERLYDGLVARYAPLWNAPPQVAAASTGALGLLPPSVPTGRPTNAEFPSAANTPAVSIMSPEPGTGSKPPTAANAALPPASARSAQPSSPPATAPTSLVPAFSSPPPAPAKKQAKQRPAAASAPPPPSAPTSLSPTATEPPSTND